MKIELTNEEYRELARFIKWKVDAAARADGRTPLTDSRRLRLEGRLWELVAKALARHDPARAPRLPFVKHVLNRSVWREATRLFAAQRLRGENPQGDASLDAPAPGTDTPLIELVAQDAEAACRAQTRRDVRRALARLSWPERMALHPLMHDDVRKADAAALLGLSPYRYERFLTGAAIPHFRRLMAARGYSAPRRRAAGTDTTTETTTERSET